MYLFHELSDGIRSAAPQNDVPVGVAGDDIAEWREGQARDVFWLLAAVKDPHLLVKRAVLVKRPERDVVLADRDDLIPVERVELGGYDRVDRTLRFGDLLPCVALLPLPHADRLLGRVVNRQQQGAVVSLAEADAGH